MNALDLIRKDRRYIQHENKKFTESLTAIPRIKWPQTFQDSKCPPTYVYRSRRFFVQVYREYGYTRISVNRTDIDNEGNWKDGISWDDLFMIKGALGYQHQDAVEVYPAQNDLVNVANIRHLWIMNEPLPFIWRKKV